MGGSRSYQKKTTTKEDCQDSKTIGGDSSINDSMLPPTLETRKRRKYNTAWMDEATESEMFVSQSDTGTTQKSGFKRKFCAEDDEALESVPQEDDFQFTRPVSSPQLACERYVSLGTYSPVERPVELEKSSNNHKQPKRKALEPKSININLIPLNKRRSTTIEDQDQNASTKEDVENGGKQTPSPNVNAYCGQNISKPQRGFLYTNKPTQDGYGKNEHVIESKSTEGNLRPLPRQILAPEEHSAYQAPMDILDPPSRPTRRQRAVVSYTEPNLRDKMRRSNNEFIAAVGSDQPRRNSNSLPVRPHANDEADINKNSKASSKLLGSGTSDTPVGNPSTQKMSMVSQRKRKPSPSASKDVLSGVNDGFGWEEDTHFNNASFGTETEPEGNIITKSQSEDVKGCILQPPAEPTDISMTHARNASKSNTRLHKQPRRHSSNPSSSAQEPPVECDIIASPPSSRAILSPSAKAGQGHLRTQTMNENPVQSEAKSHEPGGHLIKSSTLEVKPRQIKRKQRPSARRKSMML
ncbi:shugoshin family protein [Aspergillus tanneri]|uniref:Shugoshin C-terminal domain-containing protein n=1 Tax=Aspergillus tanneri TaxID=1220188 RepID=A0A5M9MQQ9_9EURO|nr:uncharacterized protein ATNIH1004_005123 [Aspergillus tanneri]KAA8649228.1 hypothetical protein ATNIH1004_005123 [Aspergillus tanneri]